MKDSTEHRLTSLERLPVLAVLTVFAASLLVSGIYLFVSRLIFGEAGFVAIANVAKSLTLSFLAYFVARGILRPIARLTVQMQKASEGDLAADFSTAQGIGVGRLVRSAQEMLHAFRDIVKKIIATTIGNVVIFEEEFKGLVANASESSALQSGQGITIAGAADQMNCSAQTVRQNTVALAATTGLVMEKACDGARMASETVKMVEAIGVSTEVLAEHIELLHGSVMEFSVTVISCLRIDCP